MARRYQNVTLLAVMTYAGASCFRPGRHPTYMSRHRAPGRRRAQGPVRRLPDGAARASAVWAAKGVAVAGVVAGATAFTVAPSNSSLELPQAAAVVTVGTRDDAGSASRSLARVAVTPAVVAPTGAAPAAPNPVGVSGVKAIPKPKPKPKPKPDPVNTAPSGQSTASSSRASSGSGGVSAKCGGLGVRSNAARLCTAVQQRFGLGSIGGFRAGAGEHGTGQALDLMISSRSQGDAVAAFVQANIGTYDVKYLIWRQRYWAPGRSWRMMEDRGSPTQNHMDHVHVTVN